MPQATPTSAPSHRLGLRLIALYKGLIAIGLVAAGSGALHLMHQRAFQRLLHWLAHLSLTDASELRWKLVDLLSDFGPHRFVAVALAAFAYAALFAVETIGLWLGRHWAEWLTVIATASLVPLEAFEAIRAFNLLKLAVLVVNIGIVIYLIRIVVERRRG